METITQTASAGARVATSLTGPRPEARSLSQRCSVPVAKNMLRCSAVLCVKEFSHNALAGRIPAGRSRGGHRAVARMAKDTAAGGYASALLELAQSSDLLDKIHSDVEAFGKLLSNQELFDFLANPVMGEAEKKAIIQTLADDGKFHEYTKSFLNLLVDKKRISLAKEIADEFEALYYDLTETQVAIVTSAVKLEDSQQALIAKKLQSMTGAKNIKLQNIVDAGLIAGFIVKYGKDGSSFIDMSVKGQLDRLAAQFEFTDAQVA